MNSDLKKLVGGCCDASSGQITREDNSAASRGMGVDLGMGVFNPRKGATKRETYVVDGINVPGGVGGSRSHRRSAGASPDSSA